MVAFSQTGDTVRRLSRLHCNLPLLAFTPVAEVRDQLALSWGVETFLTDFVEHTDDMFRQVDQAMLGLGIGKPGEYVVVVAGSPPNAPGSTNTLRVHQLGSLVDAETATQTS
jgi:pyruvate kinase